MITLYNTHHLVINCEDVIQVSYFEKMSRLTFYFSLIKIIIFNYSSRNRNIFKNSLLLIEFNFMNFFCTFINSQVKFYELLVIIYLIDRRTSSFWMARIAFKCYFMGKTRSSTLNSKLHFQITLLP